MKTLLRTTFLSGMLLIAGSLFGAQLSVGIRIGPPPAARIVHVTPARPGADFTWVDGYWYPSGRHYKWHAGYWTRPPAVGARWVGPHHDGQMFFNGYWDTEHGHVGHNHKTDRNRERDHRPSR